MVLMNLLSGKQWRLYIENRFVDMGEGEGEINWKSSIDIYTLRSVK